MKVLPKIKICGMTDRDNTLAIADCGVDALGFVFYEASKRYVCPKNLSWVSQIPSFISIVGLFVNPSKELVNQVCSQLPIDILQFHGNETPNFCNQFGKRYIKAVPMQNLEKKEVLSYIKQHDKTDFASGFLLDNYGKKSIGGSGTVFDWDEIPNFDSTISKKIILAGGLNHLNIVEAVKKTNPFAIDLSSGVEDSAGIKSISKTKEIIEILRMTSY